MALEWDLTKVADSTKALWKDESRSEKERDQAWQKTVSIIFWCAAVEIGEITEENVTDWYTRYLMISGSEHAITLEDVWRMVGLETNVFTAAPVNWFEHQYSNSIDRVKNDLDQLLAADKSV